MSETQINLAESPDFDLGGLHVSPARRRVAINGSGRELEPRVAQVLVALASARPEVVSRERLIDRCWDGRIVGDDALNRCIVALRHLAKEFSPQPFEIETVSRVGYRLIEGSNGERPAWRRPALQRGILAALIILLLVVGGAWKARVIGWPLKEPPTSIAVLPFRNLSPGDPYFAQGVGEEILGQLAREPQFRVAGSSSSSSFGEHSDIRAAARALNVDYVVEGSVRRQGDHVRVNADLLRARDGVRLWSETYDGKLDDILKIQSSIGQSVADGLRRKLVFAGKRALRPINGDAYAAYLEARGLLRSGNPQSGHDAVVLLREAIRIDPGFAPAWASLADALQLDAEIKGNEGMVAALPGAYHAAERALQLDPNLAAAHGVLATLLGSESPEAVTHLRRAAALDPRSGQGFIWLATASCASGEFDKCVAADRRAHDLDPLWPLPLRAMIDNLAIMGDRAGAEQVIKASFPDDPMTQNFAEARVARLVGDFSEAARKWSIVANSQSRWAVPSRSGLDQLLFDLHFTAAAPVRTGRALIGGSRFVAAPTMTTPPSPSEWRKHTSSPAAALVYADENALAAKLMLAARRTRELVATYDSTVGLLRIHKGQPIGALRVRDVPIVAISLRREGRSGEAEELLRRSEATVRAVYSHGRVPIFFDEDAAGIWAAQGKTNDALDALERAYARGWLHIGHTDFPRLLDEPAFLSLHSNPRFQALMARHAAHFARERAETVRGLKLRAA